MDPKIPISLASDLVKSNAATLELIYKDLAQPGCQQVGKALSTVLGLGNTILIPFQMLNATGAEIFENNMERVRKKLASLDEKDITPIAPEIGVPIVEKLMYARDPSIADLFCTLLANASSTQTCAKVHPSFVKIIERISPDEAIFLGSISDPNSAIYAIKAILTNIKTGSYRIVSGALTFEEQQLPLRFSDNMPSYLNNLEASGVIAVTFTEYLSDPEQYQILEQLYIKEFERAFPDNPSTRREFQRGFLQITEYGKMFLRAVNVVGNGPP